MKQLKLTKKADLEIDYIGKLLIILVILIILIVIVTKVIGGELNNQESKLFEIFSFLN
jgi:hypothetical protein